ncbi:hypothetical protein R1sor_006683 [Riccia sorocarpa]|uniref:XPG N-terminal domain-containing protein n=1 Tax=Riccia sorocarpa TaxID=122646 RepID=A0ABD3HNA0_9MARC
MSFYEFLIVVGRRGNDMLTNEAGNVRSHLQGVLSRTLRILEAGIKLFFLFDRKPPNLKKKNVLIVMPGVTIRPKVWRKPWRQGIRRISRSTVKERKDEYVPVHRFVHLCGCDYCDNIKGIDPQSALKLIRQDGTLEKVVENLNKSKVSDSWKLEFQRSWAIVQAAHCKGIGDP